MNSGYKIVVTIALLASMLPVAVRAQYYDWGQDPASVKWSSIRTPDVRYIFPDYYQGHAIRLMHYMDTLRPHIGHGFRYGPMSNMPLVMHTQNFQSNGLVMLAPRRMEFIVSPSVSPPAVPWLKQLAAHEYRHAVQYNNLNRGFIKILSRVLGQQGSLVGLAFLPYWLLEGDAVLAETQMTTYGRGVQPSFTIEYRAMALEGSDRNYRTDKYFSGSFLHYLPDQYQLGYQIASWAYDHYGENIWDKVAWYGSRYPYLFATTRISLNRYYNTSVSKLFRDSFTDLYEFWRSLPVTDNSTDIIPTPVTSYTTYLFPVAIDGHTVATIKSDLDRNYRLVTVDTRTGDESILCRIGYPSSGISFDGERLYWTEYRQSTFWEQRVNSMLCSYDIARARKHDHNDITRALWPVPAGDGLAYVQYNYDGSYSIRCEEWEYNLPGTISLHGLAWDDSTDAFYYIGLGDQGMFIGSVGKIGSVDNPTGTQDRDQEALFGPFDNLTAIQDPDERPSATWPTNGCTPYPDNSCRSGMPDERTTGIPAQATPTLGDPTKDAEEEPYGNQQSSPLHDTIHATAGTYSYTSPSPCRRMATTDRQEADGERKNHPAHWPASAGIVKAAGYSTLSNLRAAGGRLYFGSISSGKDESHCIDLATGKEYRISDSRYGSFSPYPLNDTTVVMTTYSIDGYLLAVGTDRFQPQPVQQKPVPDNLVNPGRLKWDVPNIDGITVSDTTELEVRRYRKGLHMFNFHSWAPISFDPEKIVNENDIDVGVGVTFLSQNHLNSVFSQAGYKWSGGHSWVRGKILFYGWAPKFEVEVQWSNRDQYVYGRVRDEEGNFPALDRKLRDHIDVTGRAYLPILLSSGSNLRRLTPLVDYEYNRALLYRPSTGGYWKGLHKTQFSLTYTEQQRMAYRDLLPRFGYSVRGSFTANPFTADFGKIYTGWARMYLPGLWLHHSLTLRGAFQYQSNGLYNFRQKVLYPRGADYDVTPRRYYSAAIDYQFPFWYPEGGINSILYFRRMRGNLLFDYARYTTFSNSRHNVYTYGAELIMDIAPFRVPFSTNAVVTLSIYKPSDRNGVRFNFGFSLPI